MPYSAEISRTAPTAFVFLLDQSASMQDAFGGSEEQGDAAPSRARVLADVMNRLLQNLVLRCAKEDGVRDYFSVGVIGYGDRVRPLILPAEGMGTTDRLVPISHLAERPLRIEERRSRVPDGEGGHVDRRVKTPVWFDPEARNGTPMCQALDLAASMVRAWIDLHPHSFPPVVVNITDGESTDGDPLRYAQELTSFATEDGEALLFNVHLSGSTAPAVEFPEGPEGLPDDFARQLFRMSSVLPFSMRAAAEHEGIAVTRDARGFLFNADPVSLVRFLEIGTRPANLR